MRTIILVSLLGIFLSANSQDMSITDIDIISYKYYLNNQWDSLIAIGNIAEKHDIQFYYLDLRLGTAYFETKKYRKATKYLLRASKENPDYTYSNNLLYYSYLYSGQDIFAENFRRKLKNRNTKKIISPSLNNVFVYSGTLFPTISSANKKSKKSTQAFTESSNVKNLWYLNSGASAFLNSKGRLTAAYTILQNEKEIKFTTTQNTELYTGTTDQKQIYIKYENKIGKNNIVSFAAHSLKANSSRQITFVDSGYVKYGYTYNYDSTISSIPVNIAVFDTVDKVAYSNINSYPYKYNTSDYAIDISLTKNFSLNDVNLGFTYLKTGPIKVYSLTGQTTIYPFYNLDLYSNFKLIMQKGLDDLEYKLETTVGSKIFNWLWFEASYYYSTLHTFADNNASYVFNDEYNIRHHSAIQFIIPIKKFNLFINYQNYQTIVPETYYTSSIYNYTTSGNYDYVTTSETGVNIASGTVEYSIEKENTVYSKKTRYKDLMLHSLNAGILWKF